RALETAAQAIADSYGSVNLAQVHKNCERAISQSESMQSMMEMMMEQTGESIGSMEGAQTDELVSDNEIDRMIDEAIVAEEKVELDEKLGSRLDDLRARFEKIKDKA